MAEPMDAVLPILRRIQADVTESRKTLADHGEKLATIEDYLTYELGLTARAKAEIDSCKTQIKAIKRRVSALERSSPKRRPK